MTRADPFILCIEDDPLSREVLRILLCEVMGFSWIEFFVDSVDFITKVQAFPEKPTIILMDIQIKPLSGYEMLRLLQEDPNFSRTKIVALTADVIYEQVNKMKQMGFSGLISKPIIRGLFPELLNRILAGESIWYIS